MGGMVAQELALLLIPQQRLLSLALAITCRGMQPAWGLLGPLLRPRVRAWRVLALVSGPSCRHGVSVCP
jgi:hypothetical protein